MKYNENDIKRIREFEKRRGIKYATTDGKLYKRLIIIGFIAWLYMMFMILAYLLGSMLITEKGKLWDAGYITVFSAFIITLLTPLAYAFRFKLIALITNIITIPILAISFIRISLVDGSISSPGSEITEFDSGFLGLKKMFFWRHGIPMLTVVAIFVWLCIIVIIERKKLKFTYDRIENNEYKPQILTDDE